MASPGPLAEAVLTLCTTVSTEQPSLAPELTATAARLHEPLHLAIAGRVSSGKSTLVNALLGARVARVGSGETTAVFTRYLHSEVEDVTLVLRDGSTSPAVLSTSGTLPPEFGPSDSEIVEVHVRLPYSKILENLTLIDTPGTSSALNLTSRGAETLFDSRRRTAPPPDCLLFVLRGREDEADDLTSFHHLTRGTDLCATNALGVITRSDQLGEPDDPLGAGTRIANRLNSERVLKPHIGGVIPVIGILAEAARCRLLRERDLVTLKQLINVPPTGFGSLQHLEAVVHDDVATDDLHRVVGILGLHGLRVAVHALRHGCSRPQALMDALLASSNLPALLEAIDSHFVRRADVMKADHALRWLWRLSFRYRDSVGQPLRDAIGRLRATPSMHSVREVWAVSQLAEGRTALPGWLEDCLLTVAGPGTLAQRVGCRGARPGEGIASLARAQAARAHEFGSRPTTDATQREIAEVIRRSFTIISESSHAAGRR